MITSMLFKTKRAKSVERHAEGCLHSEDAPSRGEPTRSAKQNIIIHNRFPSPTRIDLLTGPTRRPRSCSALGRANPSNLFLRKLQKFLLNLEEYIIYRTSKTTRKTEIMGNTQNYSETATSPRPTTDIPALIVQNGDEQKNIADECEEAESPLGKAFEKGILKREFLASNNKLIESHNHISSAPCSNHPVLPKPRISLDELLLTRDNLERLKKISNKVIEEGSIVSELTSESQPQMEQPPQQQKSRIVQKSRIFKPILLNQENLIKIKEGDVHKRYKLLQKIGEGGFGVVHKAVCLSSLEERAIKVIALKNYSCLQKKLILNEVAMLLKIDHPNIIKVYEVIEFELTFYIVTEYCDAGSLCDYLLKHKKPGEQFARNVMQKLLSAVRYLHSKCIIHRDIKLDNIVVKTARGEEEEVIIKVIDFGLSIQSFSPVAKGDKVIGTPQYIAPESIMGMYSFKSDIWSCGVILYMLLSGQSPFKAPLKGKVFERIKKEEINLQGYEWRNVSSEAKDLLYHMLAKCSLNRPSANEALSHNWFSANPMGKSTAESAEKKEQVVRALMHHQKKNNLLLFIETYTCLTKLSQAEREKMIKSFNLIDSNHNGLIELSQLKAYFARSELALSDEEVSDILKRLDLNQNQKIDLTEFLCALCNLEQYFEQEYVSELFNLFDRNGDGFIDRKELKLTLEECQGEEIAYLFQLIDSNKDDRISLEEFRSFILHQRARDAKV